MINLIFKNAKTLRTRKVKVEVEEPNLFSFLMNMGHLISIMATLENDDEYLTGITDKD